MKLSIIYDNQSQGKEMRSGWGFSCLVGDEILFDTGEKPRPLLKNMRVSGVDLSRIRGVVISHDHWDHTGGLWKLLKKRPGITVYACPGFSEGFKRRVVRRRGVLIESASPRRIGEGISLSGEIPGIYKDNPMPEQALIVESGDGLSLITGCAHPGIIRMIETVKNDFPHHSIELVLGGFHLRDDADSRIREVVNAMKQLGVRRVAPTHCTGARAIELFKQEYQGDFIATGAGSTLDI